MSIYNLKSKTSTYYDIDIEAEQLYHLNLLIYDKTIRTEIISRIIYLNLEGMYNRLHTPLSFVNLFI